MIDIPPATGIDVVSTVATAIATVFATVVGNAVSNAIASAAAPAIFTDVANAIDFPVETAVATAIVTVTLLLLPSLSPRFDSWLAPQMSVSLIVTSCTVSLILIYARIQVYTVSLCLLDPIPL